MISTFFVVLAMTIVASPPLSRYLGEKLFPEKFVGGQHWRYLGNSLSFWNIRGGWSTFSHALNPNWGLVAFLMPCMLRYTLMIVILTVFAPFVRLGALIPTLCILFLEKCWYLYGTCINLVSSIYGKFKMRQYLAEMHYINVIETIRD